MDAEPLHEPDYETPPPKRAVDGWGRELLKVFYAVSTVPLAALFLIAVLYAYAAFTFTGTTHGAGDFLILPIGILAVIVAITTLWCCLVLTRRFGKLVNEPAAWILVGVQALVCVITWAYFYIRSNARY